MSSAHLLDKAAAAMACALASGNVNDVYQLIRMHGAPLLQHHSSNGGLTPLMHAASSRYEESRKLIPLLLAHGANPNAEDHNGFTALMYAARSDKNDAIRFICAQKHASIVSYRSSNNGRTALLDVLAAKCTNSTYITLLQHGASANDADNDGVTCLMYAAHSLKKTVCLLDAGARINACNKYGGTALFYAVHEDNEETVNVLCERGAGIDHRDYKKRTPATLAARGNKARALRVLVITHNADPFLSDAEGKNATEYAKQWEESNKVMKERKSGCIVSPCDIFGCIASVLAIIVLG